MINPTFSSHSNLHLFLNRIFRLVDNYSKSAHRDGVAAKSAHGFDIPLYRRRSQAALNSARLFYGWAGSGIVRSAVPTDGMSTLFAWSPLFDIYGSGKNANRRRIA